MLLYNDGWACSICSSASRTLGAASISSEAPPQRLRRTPGTWIVTVLVWSIPKAYHARPVPETVPSGPVDSRVDAKGRQLRFEVAGQEPARLASFSEVCVQVAEGETACEQLGLLP